MTKSETVLDRVFVQPQSAHTKMKSTFFPWTKRRGSSAQSLQFSLAAPSELDVVHDSVFGKEPKIQPDHSAPYDASYFDQPTDFNRWDHYLDLYSGSTDSDLDSLAAYEVPDGSEYEPEEFMEDVEFQLPMKRQSKFRKFIRPASYARVTPIIEDPVSETQLTPVRAKPKSQFKFRHSLYPETSRVNQVSQTNQVREVREVSRQSNSSQSQELNSTVIDFFRQFSRFSFILEPFDKLIAMFPEYKVVIIGLELLIAMWILYQISVLIETVALAVRALCIPLIIVGRLFGYL